MQYGLVTSHTLLDAAYRLADENENSYIQTLAYVMSIDKDCKEMIKLDAPSMSNNFPGGVVIAPFGIKAELDISSKVWRLLYRHLQMYRGPIYQVAEDGQRMELGQPEGEVLSQTLLNTKLSAIYTADLVVGVPNVWTWLAACWGKRIIILYPDTIAQRRWFWAEDLKFARVGFTPNELSKQATTMIAGLRVLIKELATR